MSKTRKIAVYHILTAVLAVLSWIWQQEVQAAAALAEERGVRLAAVFGAGLRRELLVAVVLLGTGIFLLQLRRGEGTHSREGLFFAAVGGALLVPGLVLFLLYGGMEDATGCAPIVDLLIAVWCVLPAVPLVRSAILTGSLRRADPAAARLWRAVGLVLAAGLLLLAASGQTARFVYEPAQTAAARMAIG